MVGLVTEGAADVRLVASASRRASSKLCVELDLEGTTFVYVSKFKSLYKNPKNLRFQKL